MTSIFGPSANISAANASQWIWYYYPNGVEVQGFRFDEEFRNWPNHPEPWLAMQDESLAGMILDVADKVRDACENRMDLLMPNS